MTKSCSRMYQEIREIPATVDRLLSEGAGRIVKAAEAVREADPSFVVTVARGSSDHACLLFKYAAEISLGLPVASLGPSIASVYNAPLRLSKGLCLSISQSGKSPDIVELARAARRGGALSAAITNTPASPLADAADHPIDMMAGPELSVAATKTYVASVVASLLLLAEWGRDEELRRALKALPAALEAAVAEDWPEFRDATVGASSLFLLGRGPSMAIASEAALKFKEVCQMQAESYSSAEVMHGPVALVEKGFPVLCLATGDAAETGIAKVADDIAAMGGKVFATTGAVAKAMSLRSVRTAHPFTDCVTLIASFYAMVERLSAERGTDPDAPRHLKKVTETV
ncbi:SIS domain-containing protein [Jiella mangrovi]|uniref:SIS domain-containing protein n=1 Tax=Jiella mangrovi TaxID=2821407 RepID=A0ABS4BIN1_9HYPH|nr:SIS domain-containing protein [Jiella mangrovi]MBP0615815.1 SIS domain-containing protein [Jiella mangrovi]